MLPLSVLRRQHAVVHFIVIWATIIAALLLPHSGVYDKNVR
jgi:hypothetical protein